jgi:hypothetical protein
MRFDLPMAGKCGALILAAFSLSVSGCAMMRGEFAPRSNSAVATPTAVGSPTNLKPAVLVQDGNGPSVTTVPQSRTIDPNTLPPLPKDGTTIAQPPGKQMTPEEKARVVAELEALARGEPAATTDTVTRACATNGSTNATAGTTVCDTSPKPALRP